MPCFLEFICEFEVNLQRHLRYIIPIPAQRYTETHSHRRLNSHRISRLPERLSRQGYVPMDSNQSPEKKEVIQNMSTLKAIYDFNPCTATASMLLYAQGTSIICAHHDTLAIERRFSKHQEKIQLLKADTISDRGAGKWVFSYDASKTVIVWNCLTGIEKTSFISRKTLTAVAWIRNGSLAFGRSLCEF